MGEGGTAVHQENYGCSQIQNKITLIVEALEMDETLKIKKNDIYQNK